MNVVLMSVRWKPKEALQVAVFNATANDGSPVRIRMLRPDDAAALDAFLRNGLSSDSKNASALTVQTTRRALSSVSPSGLMARYGSWPQSLTT